MERITEPLNGSSSSVLISTWYYDSDYNFLLQIEIYASLLYLLMATYMLAKLLNMALIHGNLRILLGSMISCIALMIVGRFSSRALFYITGEHARLKSNMAKNIICAGFHILYIVNGFVGATFPVAIAVERYLATRMRSRYEKMDYRIGMLITSISFSDMLFTAEITARLLELVDERREDLFPDSRKKNADSIRNQSWETITEIINVEFPDGPRRTAKQVRQKFKDVKQAGKQDLQDKRRHSLGTGGGPPAPQNELSEKVHDMFAGSPSFEGLTSGLETQTTDLDSPENSPKSQSRSMTYTPVAKRMKQEETARKTMEQLQLEVLQQQGEVLRQQKQLNEQLSQVLSHFSDVLDQISATLRSQDNGRNEMAQWPL
ncbi:serpentine type 7TM GPCR receptor class ab chemoreceptor domain-containing protein [Ditylenchus destructor]|nr:serpentine type 7TM GPCR receptor class ab chemoreceptor domain-containing protein [Ditylenchus destructor]